MHSIFCVMKIFRLYHLAGLAGSGKTFLTLMAAIDGLNKKKYERIVITRNIQPVGRDIGFLPGDVNDKDGAMDGTNYGQL